MSFTHKLSRSWSRSDATPLTYDKEVTQGVEQNVSEAIPDGSTDLLIPNFTIDLSQLKALFIACDQGITFETNNPGGASAAPDDSLSVPANQPVSWATGDVMSCPITTDVTQVYVTNDSGATANLEIRTLEDATP